MLKPLEPLRALAHGGAPLEPFAGPVLVAREMLTGDLSFNEPSDDTVWLKAPPGRKGSTLFLDLHVDARERLSRPTGDGRFAVTEEYAVLAPKAVPGPIMVGRAVDNDLVVRDPSVSAHHAQLHVVAGTDWCFVVDTASRNGTAVNGRRLVGSQRAELQSGDEIVFGRALFVFLSRGDLTAWLTDGF